MNHLGTAVIRTPRLILRPYTLDDVQDMYRNWANDPEVVRYLTWPVHSSPEVTRNVLTSWIQCYDRKDFYNWAIELKETGHVIGNISVVSIDEQVHAAELGWCMGQAWWGQGIMPEAAGGVLEFLFEYVGFERIAAEYDVENPKSGRVMQKIGMTCEGTLRRFKRNNRGIVDMRICSILKDEYVIKKTPAPF